MGLFLRKNHLLRILVLNFSSNLGWGSYIIPIAKTALIRSMKSLSPEVVLYLYKSTICPCMEYCCHVWAGAPSCCLELLDCYENEYTGLLVLEPLNPSFEPLAHRRNVASLNLFYRYYFCRCSSELAQLFPLPFSCGRSTRYSDRLDDFSVTIPRCDEDVSFQAQLDSGILCL